MYAEMARKLRLRNKTITSQVDAMQSRSQIQDMELNQMRAKNLEEMAKSEKKLEKLQFELNQLTASIDLNAGGHTAKDHNPVIESVFKFDRRQTHRG